MKKIKSISLMFPVFRDKRTVKKMIIQSLRVLKTVARKYEIIIVDDGCPEKSGIIAKKIAKNIANIKVFFHKKNLGYGAALRTGIEKSKYDWIFQIDGDAEYSVNDLKRLLKETKNSDLVITYRYKKKYKTNRIIISWFYNKLLRILFGTKFKDISTGSRLINRKLIKKLKLTSSSPFLGAELAIKAKEQNSKVNEVGIHTYPRTFGAGSSVSFRNIMLTVKDMLILFFKIRLKIL
jgi:glycosyltransferase involved in cell wall biosynthesis